MVVNPLVILIPVLVVAAIVVVVASARRRDTGDAIGSLSRETLRSDRSDAEVLASSNEPTAREVERSAVLARAGGGQVAENSTPVAPATFVPRTPEQVEVSRRQFFNRGIIAFFILGISGFGGAVLAMLWPRPTEGFGAALSLGPVSEVKDQIAANNGFLYFAEGRMWLTEFPAGAVGRAREVYGPTQLAGIEAGVIALWQTCPHLGCRVPECTSSQWFECPCHGSQYNQVGERQGGPAPRGMDGFAMEVSADGVLTVDTGAIIEGRPIGVDTIGQEPAGPHCVTGGAH